MSSLTFRNGLFRKTAASIQQPPVVVRPTAPVAVVPEPVPEPVAVVPEPVAVVPEPVAVVPEPTPEPVAEEPTPETAF